MLNDNNNFETFKLFNGEEWSLGKDINRVYILFVFSLSREGDQRRELCLDMPCLFFFLDFFRTII